MTTQVNRLPDLAAELVRSKVDIIVASLTPAVTAASKATSDIPIAMAPAGDPVATGLITSLARPGGNITGVSRLRRTVWLGRRVSNLCILKSEFAKTLSPGGGTQTCASRFKGAPDRRLKPVEAK